MSENNINGYANEQTTLSDSDWFDIDAYLGVDDYESKKVSFGTIKNQILSQTSNLYNSNGTLTGDRFIVGDNNQITFNGNSSFQVSGTNSFQFTSNDGNSISSSLGFFNVVCAGSGVDANKVLRYNDNYHLNWNNTTVDRALVPLGFVTANGTTANRPTQGITGQTYFDTDLGYPIWFNGTSWVNATGQVV